MAINKIKLKQIDADFSGLVGQYGSGYFATTGSFNSLSGSTVPYSYISTGGFLYNTGAQSVSGVKNFFSRPTFSGKSLAKLEEVVTINDAQTVIGAKSLDGEVTFNDAAVNFYINDIDFTEATFTLDSNSATSLVGQLGALLVNTTSAQTVGGVKNFTSTPKVNGSGVLVSGAQAPFYVVPANSSIRRFPVFVEDSGSGFKYAQINTGLEYNSIAQAFRCKTFSGDLVGTASNATSAVNATNAVNSTNSTLLYIGSDSTNASRNLIFTTGNTAGNRNSFTTAGVTVNPSTNLIGASTFSGGFLGNSLTAATSAGLSISTTAVADFINFQFPTNTTAYRMSNTFFTPLTSGTRALGQASTTWSTVYATTTSIQTSDRNLKTEISEIPDSWLDAWQEVDYVRYKFKDAVAQKGLSGARWHVGHIAQNIHEKFASRGLDAFDIGMLCYDKWDQSIDGNGNIVPSGEIWSIRPDECQFMEMALMRRSLNRLKSGILI